MGKYFSDLDSFLALWELEEGKEPVEDFVTLVMTYALGRAYTDKITVGQLARSLMRTRKLSPLVFWSRMKRAVSPILSADRDTLLALGVPGDLIPVGRPMTCPELVAAISAVIDVQPREDDFEELRALLDHGDKG